MSISVVVLGQDPDLVRRIESYRGELMVVRVCQEIPEAVAACTSNRVDVLLVAEPGLMPAMEQVDYVQDRDVVLVLLATEVSPIPGVISAAPSGSAAELETLIAQGLRERELDRPSGGALGQGLMGAESGREPGRVSTFWSGAGSPGRSTLALNFAVEAAAAGESVVLIDADTYASSLAIQLGMLDEAAAVAQLCRVVDTGHFDAARLEAVLTTIQVGSSTLKVASGIPRASRWPEVRAASLRRAVAVLKEHHDRVILDVAAPVETDEQLSFDTYAPQRNGVSVEALRFSDEVIMVVAANSVGIPRAIRALDELAEAQLHPQLRILFNKVGSASSGRAPRRGISEAWERFGPSYPILGFLPDDHSVCQAAVLAGSSLLELAPRCALRSEIRALAGKKLPFRATTPNPKPGRERV